MDKKEEYYHSIIENILDLILILKADGTIIYVSPSVKNSLGYIPEDVLGKNAFEFIHNEDRDTISKAFALKMQKPQVKQMLELRVLRKDGSWCSFEGVGANLLDNPTVEGIIITCRDITERKKAENALQEKEEKYKQLFNLLPQIVFEIDVNGNLTFINQNALSFMGYTKDDLDKGINIFQVLTPDSRAAAKENIVKKLQGYDTATAIEYNLQKKDGSIFPGIAYSNPIMHENQIVGFRGIVIDMSEHNQADEIKKQYIKNLSLLSQTAVKFMELQQLQDIYNYIAEQLRELIGGGYIAVNSYDKESNLLTCRCLSGIGKFAEKIISLIGANPIGTSYPVDEKYMAEMINGDINEIQGGLHAMSFEKISKNVSSAIEKLINIGNIYGIGFSRKKELYAIAIIMTTKDLNPINRDLVKTFISQASVAMQRIYAEDALRKSEEQLKLVLEGSNDGLWDINLKTGVVQLNEIGAKILGYSSEELELNISLLEKFVHSEDKQIIMKMIKKHFDGLIPQYRNESRILTKSGRWIWLLVRGKVVLRDENNKPVRMAGTFIDITERKEAEQDKIQLSKLNSLGVLAGGIAHDFNNILSVIIGNISLAMMDIKDAKINDYLQSSITAGERAANLTQQLLTFAKGGTLIKKATSVKKLLEETVVFSLTGSNVEAKFSIPEDAWLVEIDVNQFSQVIQNLVINAKQAMPEGGIIEIKTENITTEDKRKYLNISIKDHGIGIAEKHLINIFDPYFTTKQTGSGLGLAVAYTIVKKHGGQITVESKVGAGSTFDILLPAAEGKIVLEEEQKHEDSIVEIKNKKILIMDDEESIINYLENALTNAGCNVVASRDGSEAIKLYREAFASNLPFDAVIMDLTVPGGKGGKETIKKLLSINPGIKAIVSSGYSDDPVMSDFAKYGFSAVLPKPYQINELFEVLVRVISKA